MTRLAAACWFARVALVVLVTAHAAPGQVPKAVRGCRHAVATTTARLSRAVLRAEQHCTAKALRAGTDPTACRGLGTAGTSSAIERAETAVRRAVGGGRDRCAGLGVPTALGYPATCPPPCGGSISTFAELAECVICVNEQLGDSLIIAAYGTIGVPVAGAAQKCVNTLARRSNRIFRTQLQLQEKCEDRVERGVAFGDCRQVGGYDPKGSVARAATGLQNAAAGVCTDTIVAALDVCAPQSTTVTDAAGCLLAAAASGASTAFGTAYPLLPASLGPQACAAVADSAITTIAGLDFARFPAAPQRPYAPASGGRVWYVATTGNDGNDGSAAAPLLTVNRAVALATSGDVILVRAGAYAIAEPSDGSLGINLATPNLVLANVRGEAVTLQPANAGVHYGIAASGDNQVIDGFSLSGFAAAVVTFGRLSSSQRNLVLQNLSISGGSDGVRSVVVPGGVNPQPVIQGLLFQDSTIAGSTLVGFNCGEGPCNDVFIRNVRVDMGAGGAGNSGADAVAMENGDNVLVLGSEATNASADGFDFKATRVAVINSSAHDLARNGIKLWRGGDIVNSLVFNTGADAAIVFDGGARYRMLNTVVARHSVGQSAYALTAAYDNPTEPGRLDIVNSIFYGNSGPAWVAGAFQLNVQNSLFFGSANGQELVWAARGARAEIVVGEAADPITALEAAGGGSGNLAFADPQFVSPVLGDYHLAAASAARDAGVAITEAFPTFDLSCNPRVLGAAPDLGPYEMP